jgi:Coenzyme PQQ synthesis protein D (PqqD)
MRHEKQPLPLARTDALVVKELQDEVLVYDLKRDKAHCLNPTAAAVWKHCDGKLAVAEMASLLESELEKTVATEVVWLALQQLDKFHLLQERVILPQERQGLSRRDLIRRIGVTAIILPAIISISAPTALAQGSCRPLDTFCTNSAQCCSECCSDSVCVPEC